MKLLLKTGEHIRIQTDGEAPVIVWIDKGEVHISAQPQNSPACVCIADNKAVVERDP